MKTVLFLRHGKSDWDADYAHDHERPLARRGRQAAKTMGRLLAERGPVPESIVTSSAVRAVQTLKRARKAGGWDAPTRVTDALYHAGAEDLLAIIRAEPDATGVLLLVGHEPTWSETVSRLAGLPSVRFPTAALARVDLGVDHWREAAFGSGTLVWLLKPRDFS